MKLFTRLVYPCLLISTAAVAGTHDHAQIRVAGSQPSPVSSREFVPCENATDRRARPKQRFSANHVHNALVVVDAQGGWRLGEGEDIGAQCLAILTGEDGLPVGPVESEATVDWGSGHREHFLSFAFGSMLDGKPADRHDLKYIALQLPGLPLQWIPSPCGARGERVVLFTKAPDGFVEVSAFVLDPQTGLLRRKTAEEMQAAIKKELARRKVEQLKEPKQPKELDEGKEPTPPKKPVSPPQPPSSKTGVKPPTKGGCGCDGELRLELQSDHLEQAMDILENPSAPPRSPEPPAPVADIKAPAREATEVDSAAKEKAKTGLLKLSTKAGMKCTKTFCEAAQPDIFDDGPPSELLRIRQ